MSRIGRLAGALLVETEGAYYLVGNTKEPCDWARAGFEPPSVDPSAARFIKLNPRGVIALGTPHLTMDVEGERLARALAERLLVERNGSVSERLWRLVLRRGVPEDDAPENAETHASIDARWLGEIPAPIWNVVRDTVLRCV